MPPRDLGSHIQSLIGQTVVEQKIAGTSSSDVEATAILQSIALNLILQPRAILYLTGLARNDLLNVVAQEIAAVSTLLKTIDDLSNTTFTPTDSTTLSQARTALLQMESLDKVDSKGNSFQRFSNSVDDFLNKSLAKNVRKLGQPTLSRPDTEAAVDLPTDYTALKTLHTELNDKLFALSVGIENFLASPLATILGLSTAYRTRLDIDDVINIVDAGEAGSQSQDIAVRLIGDRAAVRAVGAPPAIDSLLIDTVNGLPAGYTMKARSDLATASILSNPAPFVFAPGADSSITVNGVTQYEPNFPQMDADLNNQAFLTNTAITYPVTIPTGKYLFVHLHRPTAAAGYDLQPDGTYLKQVRVSFPPTPRTETQIIADLSAALAPDCYVTEYVDVGSGRIIIIANSPITSINISPIHTEPSASTVGDINLFTDSANVLLGFAVGQTGSAGSTPIGIVIDALNIKFNALVEASPTSDQNILIETLADSVGTYMTMAMDPSLAVNGPVYATSQRIKLYGTVNGVVPPAVPGDTPTPINPTSLVDVGDTFTGPTGSSGIAQLTTTRIVLANAVRTFDGDATALSALVVAVEALNAAVQTFIVQWLETPYGSGLTTLDRAIAALSGKTTPATQNAARAILNDLSTALQNLATTLNTGTLLSTSGTDEKAMVNGIINTLTERKFDRALDLLLQLKIQEFFELTGDTASYGGALSSAMSSLATTDIVFPDTQQDDPTGLKGVITEPEA